MMSLSHELAYAEGDGWRAVELPYAGGSLALDVIVPDDLAALQSSMTAGRLESITAALAPRHVELRLPRFAVQTETDLAKTLALMGMPLAFDEQRADFSGMTVDEALHISAVIQQANIKVDEKGTEASAATAVAIAATGLPMDTVSLTVDRPFLFVLRDLPTGAPLFLGRVVDPTATS